METLQQNLCCSGHARWGSPPLPIVLGQEDQSKGRQGVRLGLLGLRETSHEELSSGLEARMTASCRVRDLSSIVPPPCT